MNSNIDFLLDNLNAICSIDSERANLFMEYYNLLVSSPINITSIKDFKEVTVKHFYDSLLVLYFLEKDSQLKIIDIGSGGGFPGIPIAITNPLYELTLLETVGKKVNFLSRVIETINLTNAQTICSRAEDEGRKPQMREKFDIAISRAVAPMNILLEYVAPFVKVGGFAYIYKGPDYEKELILCKNAIEELNLKIIEKKVFKLPFDFGERIIIKVEKVGPTADKYPRRSGIPRKRPL